MSLLPREEFDTSFVSTQFLCPSWVSGAAGVSSSPPGSSFNVQDVQVALVPEQPGMQSPSWQLLLLTTGTPTSVCGPLALLLPGRNCATWSIIHLPLFTLYTSPALVHTVWMAAVLWWRKNETYHPSGPSVSSATEEGRFLWLKFWVCVYICLSTCYWATLKTALLPKKGESFPHRCFLFYCIMWVVTCIFLYTQLR